MPEISTGVGLLNFLSNTRDLNMGPLITIIVNLCSYKDGDAGNLRKFEYFYDYI